MDDSPANRKFRAYLCELIKDMGTFEDVMVDVGEAFDLDAAVGVQLDMIGSILGLTRKGFSDIRYATFLDIQANLLLSPSREDANWTGTHNNILALCRKFIGTGIADPIVLFNFAPYNFILSVPGVTLSELDTLITFIANAIYAGVLGQVIIILASDSLWDSDSVGPIADGGVWDSASVGPLAGASTWGTVKIIPP
jgi:hypothetical protein